ncbi:MAG: DNA translocase FtsK [Patulibacter sp.]
MSRTRTPARTPKAPAARARSGKTPPAGANRPRGAVVEASGLDQRQFDQIGLGLLALAVFLVFLMYLGSWGGAIGDGMVSGLRSLFGQIAYLVPPVVAATGMILILRPLLPAVRPFRTGAILLVLSLMLLFAAGTFGLGGGTGRDALWTGDVVQPRGGVIGDAMYWAISSLLGAIGAHVFGVTMLLAGVLILTGASIASLVSRTGESLRQTTTAFRRVPSDDEPMIPVLPRRRAKPDADAEPPTTTSRPRAKIAKNPTDDERAEPADEDDVPEFPVRPRRAATTPPEPSDDEQISASRGPRIRGSKTSGPELDGALRYPDLFGGDADVRLDLPTPDPVSELDDLTVEDEIEPPTVVVPAPVAPRPTPVPKVPVDEDTQDADDADARPTLAELRSRQPMGGDTQAPDEGYLLPDPALLKVSAADQLRPDTAGQQETANALVEALSHFNVDAKLVATVAGPHITRYELRLAPGIKMSKVAQLKDDLAYALAATDIRILAPVPGKTAVGVEVPNKRRRIVHLGDVYSDPPADASPLTVWLGKDVSGAPIYADLAKMPHLLVAGTTGAGKSGCVNAMLSSILLHATPDDVRLVLVDPKQVELNHYESIPHLLTPVITSPKMAANALQNLVREMEWRYGVMSVKKTRGLIELNRVRIEEGDEPLPYILCVIDELADLMMVAPADVEDAIIRIAQKARAVGIHLVLATQSPRVDVITGMIKANVPSRIAFSVSSQTDSRVILDQNGAESLLGRGDMLFNPVGSSKLNRIQGAYIDEAEIAALTEHWARQGEPELREDLLEATEDEAPAESPDDNDADSDPLLADAIEMVVEMGAASTSGLQRRLRVGYTRAGRLVDMMERRGIVSGFEGSKARQVLVSPMDLPRVLAAARGTVTDDVDVADDPETPVGPAAPPIDDTVDDRTGDHAAIGSSGE